MANNYGGALLEHARKKAEEKGMTLKEYSAWLEKEEDRVKQEEFEERLKRANQNS